MTPNEYQQKALTFLNDTTKGVEMRDNAVLGLVGESGEVADKLKKHLFYGAPDKHLFDKNTVLDEGGDVLWYVALLCTWADITLEECMQYNIDKLSKRYPDKFSAVASYSRYEND